MKSKANYSYLLLGFIFLFFFNGKWILPLAAFLAPVFLIRFMRYQKPLKGFLFVIIAGWISNIFIWKGMIPISGFFYYFLMFIMSVFTSIPFLIDRIYTQKLKGLLSTLVFPSAYVIFDFIVVSTNPSGSYGTLAHTQSSLAFQQIFSITGIWALVFMITWSSSVLNWLWDHSFERNKIKQAFLVYGIPMIALLLFGQIRLALADDSKTVRIAAININKAEWKQRYNSQTDSISEKVNQDFLANAAIAANAEAKIVFGSEIIIHLNYNQENEFIEKAKVIAQKNNIYLGLPMMILPKDYPEKAWMNKIVWISPAGQVLFSYYKAKPTPGEGNYGDGIIKYFDSPYGRISSAICFDMDFPSLINQCSTMNIDIMLVPGLDSKEIAPYHTFVASTRAIEQGFNLFRSASQGLSAAFNYKGQLIASQDFFTSDDLIFYADVPTKGQKTAYAALGNYFAWLCILFFLFISYKFFKKD